MSTVAKASLNKISSAGTIQSHMPTSRSLHGQLLPSWLSHLRQVFGENHVDRKVGKTSQNDGNILCVGLWKIRSLTCHLGKFGEKLIKHETANIWVSCLKELDHWRTDICRSNVGLQRQTSFYRTSVRWHFRRLRFHVKQSLTSWNFHNTKSGDWWRWIVLLFWEVERKPICLVTRNHTSVIDSSTVKF